MMPGWVALIDCEPSDGNRRGRGPCSPARGHRAVVTLPSHGFSDYSRNIKLLLRMRSCPSLSLSTWAGATLLG